MTLCCTLEMKSCNILLSLIKNGQTLVGYYYFEFIATDSGETYSKMVGLSFITL